MVFHALIFSINLMVKICSDNLEAIEKGEAGLPCANDSISDEEENEMTSQVRPVTPNGMVPCSHQKKVIIFNVCL